MVSSLTKFICWPAELNKKYTHTCMCTMLTNYIYSGWHRESTMKIVSYHHKLSQERKKGFLDKRCSTLQPIHYFQVSSLCPQLWLFHGIGAIQVLHNVFFCTFDTYLRLRNANNIGPCTFVTLIWVDPYTPPPPIALTLEWAHKMLNKYYNRSVYVSGMLDSGKSICPASVNHMSLDFVVSLHWSMMAGAEGHVPLIGCQAGP